MVVPPADDGSLGGRQAPATPSRAYTLAPLVVIVVCLGVLTYLFVADTDSDRSTWTRIGSFVTGEGRSPDDPTVLISRERDAVARQATQFVLRSNTYGPADLDEQNQLSGYAERVRAVITSKQQATFEENLPFAVQTVAQAGYGRTCDVVAAGVESLGTDEAVALVAGEFVGSYPDPQDAKKRIEDIPRQFRVKVNLRKVEGTWLVDSFEPVTGDAEQSGEGGTEPAPSEPAIPGAGESP